MRIELRRSAVNDLKLLPKSTKEVINSKIAELANFPDVNNIKKLTNFEPAYRLRVGSYRVLFDVLDDKVVIGRVLHRQAGYKR